MIAYVGIDIPAWARLVAATYDARLKAKFAGLYERAPDPYAYDASPFELGRRERMTGLLRLDSGSRVLEVGCAGGFITEALARAAGRVEALDIAEGALAAARARLSAAGLGGKCSFERRSLLETNPEPGAYDAIVVGEVLYYLGSRNALMRFLGADAALLDRCLSALIAGLKPGGRLLLAHSFPDGERASREAYGRRAAELGAARVSEEVFASAAEKRECLLSLFERPR